MSWSPDNEIGVFLTNNANILELTKGFEVLSEASIHVDSFGEGT